MPGRVFAAAAVAGALMAVAFAVRGGVATGPDAPKVDFGAVLDDMNGRKVDLASFKGKPLVLNLWATWCGPCRLETPQLVSLAEKYKAQGLTIIGISTDDKAEDVKAFADEFKVTYPMLVGLGHDAWLQRLGYVGTLPFSLLVDKSGNVVGQITGLETTAGWESHIEGLLK
jgi:thiol-disulfide isomerase/thioredoxin